MVFRRLWTGAPLALAVAAAAHVAGFGFDHAPGGLHAVPLAAVEGEGLLLAALTAFLAAALRGRLPIATKGPSGKETVALALAGFAGFAVIEVLEGHAPFGGLHAAVAALAVVPVAVAVALLADRVGRSFDRAGTRFAAFARTRGARARAAFIFVPSADAPPRGDLARSVARGRAPPALA
jgi:hypothetical protein